MDHERIGLGTGFQQEVDETRQNVRKIQVKYSVFQILYLTTNIIVSAYFNLISYLFIKFN